MTLNTSIVIWAGSVPPRGSGWLLEPPPPRWPSRCSLGVSASRAVVHV